VRKKIPTEMEGPKGKARKKKITLRLTGKRKKKNRRGRMDCRDTSPLPSTFQLKETQHWLIEREGERGKKKFSVISGDSKICEDISLPFSGERKSINGVLDRGRKEGKKQQTHHICQKRHALVLRDIVAFLAEGKKNQDKERTLERWDGEYYIERFSANKSDEKNFHESPILTFFQDKKKRGKNENFKKKKEQRHRGMR